MQVLRVNISILMHVLKANQKNHKYKCGWEPGAMTQLWEDTNGFKD
jgi:hypothetical protein